MLMELLDAIGLTWPHPHAGPRGRLHRLEIAGGVAAEERKATAGEAERLRREIEAGNIGDEFEATEG